MTFSCYGLTDIGKVRSENQDAFLVREPDDRRVLAERGVLVAVADGMGGLEGGQLASRVAVDTLCSVYYATAGEPREALEAAVQEANRKVREHAVELEEGKLMGSTLTAACCRGESAWIAHVGDSRAYHYRRGTLRQVTKDHSLVQELAERRSIELSAAKWNVNRNIVTRGLGLQDHVEVDLFEIARLEPGDVLILSSDGLHELLLDQDLVKGVERHGADLEAACREAIRTARERGGPDNITLVLLRVEPETARSVRGAETARATARSGWLLPLALFVSFALGVLLTLALQGPPVVDGARLEASRTALDDAIERLEGTSAGAASRDARAGADVLEGLRRVRALLEGATDGGERVHPEATR